VPSSSASTPQPKEVKEKSPATASDADALEPKKEKKQPRFVPLDLTSISTPSKWTGTVSAAVTQAPTGHVVAAPKPKSASVTTCTTALAAWSPQAHGGRRATDLTLADAQEVVGYARYEYKRRNSVFIIKGAGSGEYAERVQLKIVHKQQHAPGSNKKATFHLTLRQDVFDQLNLTESDE
jgi:hypothetical protein